MRLFLSVLLLICCISCSVAGYSARSAQYSITVQLDTVGIGTRPLTVTLTDLQRKPVTDATVVVTPIMQQHGMLGIPMPLQVTDDGVYTLSELELTMTGEWQLQFDITRAGQHDIITLPVIIQ
ncbi:MAG: FixH family protein [Roseiflexaceae bacterium]